MQGNENPGALGMLSGSAIGIIKCHVAQWKTAKTIVQNKDIIPFPNALAKNTDTIISVRIL